MENAPVPVVTVVLRKNSVLADAVHSVIHQLTQFTKTVSASRHALKAILERKKKRAFQNGWGVLQCHLMIAIVLHFEIDLQISL